MNHMELRLFLHKNIYNENTIQDLYKTINEFDNDIIIQDFINNRTGIILQFKDKNNIDTYEKINTICKTILFNWINKYNLIKEYNINLEDNIDKIYNVGKLSDDTIIIYL